MLTSILANGEEQNIYLEVIPRVEKIFIWEFRKIR